MFKRITALMFLLFFVMQLTGCATGRKQSDLQMQGMRNEISVLQAQLQSKDEEISNLREALLKAEQQQFESGRRPTKRKVIAEVKSRPKIREIQTALANAGFNPGAIDGRMGRQTRDAIRDFQRASGLVADGKVGRQTWAMLKEYLYKKAK